MNILPARFQNVSMNGIKIKNPITAEHTEKAKFEALTRKIDFLKQDNFYLNYELEKLKTENTSLKRQLSLMKNAKRNKTEETNSGLTQLIESLYK